MDIIKEKWNEILERVKEEHELGEVSYKTWIKPLTVHNIEDNIEGSIEDNTKVTEEDHLNYNKALEVQEQIKKTEADDGADIRCSRVTDLLKAENLLENTEEDNTPPFDVTSSLLTFPAPRSARLQTFARSDAGFLGGVAYSSMRGYGAVHPTVSELRCGYV